MQNLRKQSRPGWGGLVSDRLGHWMKLYCSCVMGSRAMLLILSTLTIAVARFTPLLPLLMETLNLQAESARTSLTTSAASLSSSSCKILFLLFNAGFQALETNVALEHFRTHTTPTMKLVIQVYLRFGDVLTPCQQHETVRQSDQTPLGRLCKE